MKNELYIMLRDNSILCRKPNDTYTYECKLDIDNMPNIPFYHHFWDDPDKYKSIFNKFCKKHSLVKRLIRPTFTIAIPEDALKVETTMISEFFQICGARTIVFAKEFMLLTTNTCFISVIGTCRMIVVRYIKANTVKKTMYIENREYTDDEFISLIQSLHIDCKNGDLPVFFNGNGLERYSNIGKYVSVEEMFSKTKNIPQMRDITIG